MRPRKSVSRRRQSRRALFPRKRGQLPSRLAALVLVLLLFMPALARAAW